MSLHSRQLPQSDADLIELSRHEPEEFTELFRRHAPCIQRYVTRRLGPDAADDIVAETFLLAFRQRDRYGQGRADARPWLFVRGDSGGARRPGGHRAVAAEPGPRQNAQDPAPGATVMSEMDQLTSFRNEVPPGVTPRAEQMFRAALNQELSAEQHVVAPRRNGIFRSMRGARQTWRYAVAATAAAGLAAGVLVATQSSGPAKATAEPMTAELLADRAAAAALTQPNLSAGQWIYQVRESSATLPGPHRPADGIHVQSGWMTADGTITYGGAGIIGNPIFPYSKLDSLPRDPAKLNTYFRGQDPVKSDNNSAVEFGQIRSMLFGMVLPPWLEAEMFHALALIPMVRVQDHVKDIAGRAGVAFVLPETGQSEKQEIILDASDYRLLGDGTWHNPSTPTPDIEDAILKEYPVAELGSTQQAIAPPSAAEQAAEKIDFYEEYAYYTPKINSVLPGQWLYREVRTGGTSVEIWATADDSAQASYVHGELQVCNRTEPCAASEHWLMPQGPSFTVLYPPTPQQSLTPAQVKQLKKEPLKQRLATWNKLLAQFRKQHKTLPTLSEYPRPLLSELNGYQTGCAGVAGDCNVVSVAANVLTGYGNYPYLDASWFLALADVPGVSLTHITDEAGHQDIEFTFPAQDGVTGILVNATLLDKGEIQYEGYLRDGQQTLVLNQALVSGPGVRP
jgi:hypothetical protein